MESPKLTQQEAAAVLAGIDLAEQTDAEQARRHDAVRLGAHLLEDERLAGEQLIRRPVAGEAVTTPDLGAS